MIQQLFPAEFVDTNAKPVNSVFIHFYMISRSHHILPIKLLVNGKPKSTNKAIQITLKWMKVPIVEAHTNLERSPEWMAKATNC